jgi:Flp pilus assembly protein CpaB
VLLALGFALVAVILVNAYIEYVRRQVEQASFNVYVLTRSLAPGDRLKERDVRKVAVPKSFENNLRELHLMNDDEVQVKLGEGTPVERAASQGDLLRWEVYTAPDGPAPVEISKGKRLVSLPVNSRTVPGSLRPGMFVDIEAAFNRGGAVPEVLPVMERVKVKAVGTHTVGEEASAAPGRTRSLGSFRAITIEVSPAEATDLSMIERVAVGDFELHLHNPDDNTAPKIPNGGINPDVLDLLDKRKRDAPATRR